MSEPINELTRKKVSSALTALSETRSEPICAYLYDLSSLEQHIQFMLSALPHNAQLYYAAKANPDRKLLSQLAPWVAGFEAASGGEMAWLYDAHPEKPLIFGGPGKLESELKEALKKNIECFHVESLTELKRLAKLTSGTKYKAAVMLRMNIPLQGIALTKLAMGGKPTPFGLAPSELSSALRLIAESDGLRLEGFHFHTMSHQLCAQSHLDLIALYCSTFKHWCKQYDLSPPVLNVGGGMGIDYSPEASHFNWLTFCEGLKTLLPAMDMDGTSLRFECGRFVTAGCGYYVMEVLDLKCNHGQHFAIGRGGTHHFRTPAAQSHSHPFFVVPGKNRTAQIDNTEVTLVGQLCTPKDVLASNQYVRTLAIGDYLVFPLAGAYAWNISHQNFLMHAAPEFHYI